MTPVRSDTRTSSLDLRRLEAQVTELSEAYAHADPFPHIIIDDFLESSSIRRAAAAFPPVSSDDWIHYLHINEKKHGLNKLDALPPEFQQIIGELNSAEFCAWLSRLTGIDGLLADPDLEGGGLHQSQPGGYLNVHTDFTAHPHRHSWRRRVNVLVYLNDNWKDEYNGHLELWDTKMEHCVQRIAPVLNRCVIFTTDDKSYHGHPLPLACPDDVTRKSIALYFFTDEGNKYTGQSTRYKARPQDGLYRIWIGMDNFALRVYSSLKRRLGWKDGGVSNLLQRFTRKK